MKQRVKQSTLDKKYDERKIKRLTLLVGVVVIVVVFYLLLQFVFGISRVDGKSMYPTLEDSQTVLFSRLNTSYEVGDVVCVKMPSGELYVKRIVAATGDVVDIQDGKLYINGEAVSESYAQGNTYEEDGLITYPYEIGENKYFVLGDNREESVDSRSFGAVVKEQILGTLIGVD